MFPRLTNENCPNIAKAKQNQAGHLTLPYCSTVFQLATQQRSSDFTFALLTEPGKKSEKTSSMGGWAKRTLLLWPI